MISALLICTVIDQSAKTQTMIADFGTIYIFDINDAKKILKKDFVYTNNSPGFLKISSLKTSCGSCTNVKTDRDIISPGESTHFLTEVDLSKKGLSKSYELNEMGIVKLEGTCGEHILRLLMRAKIELRGLPQIVNLGRLKGENYRIRRFINIIPPPRRKFTIKSITCSASTIDISYKKKFLLRPHRFQIYFEFDMEDMKVGPNNFGLNMEYNLDGKERSQTTLVHFEKVPKVKYPKSISMGIISAKTKSISKQFRLLPGYKGAIFKIKRVKTEPSEYLSCTWNREKGSDCMLLKVKYDIPPYANYGKTSRGNIIIEFLDGIESVNIALFALLLENE